MTKFANQKPHVVVIGAGILGASIAFHLSLRGAQVTVVDAGQPGHGTTRVSFAWLNAYSKNPYHYHDLNRRSLDMWPRFAHRLAQAQDVTQVRLTWGGELRWAATETGASALIERAKVLQRWGYPTRILDRESVSLLEPELVFEDFHVASYSDLDGHVDTGQAVQACMAALVGRDAELCLQTPVTNLEIDGGVVHAVGIDTGTSEGAIPCDAVVLAGGADTPALAELANVKLPLYHTFGATVLTEPLPPLFKNIALLHSPRERAPLINFRQFADGTVMFQGNGSADYEEGDRGRDDAEVEKVLADATAILPALQNAKIARVNRGRRPIPQDGEPVIGFTEQVSNLYVATTHSGVTLAPIIGELAAIEIVEQVEVELLQPYRLARFVG